MPAAHNHNRRPRLIAATALAAAAGIAFVAPDGGLHPRQARGASVSQLGSELNSKQAQLNANQAQEQQLSSSLADLDQQIHTLTGQIALVQSREAEVQATLAADRARLARAKAALQTERHRAAELRHALSHARHVLSVELVAQYERPQPSLVSVVLEANGFNQLLEQLRDLGNAENQEQAAITVTRRAKAKAEAEAARIGLLAARDQSLTAGTETQARALAGMNQLLQSRESALGDVQAARQAALGAAQARGSQLQTAIAHVRAEQQAAEQAAAAAAAAAAARAAAAQQAASQESTAATSTATSVSAVPSGGWAIPESIVMCESGGQNLPPNSAGASGFYQIIPSTWRLFGGSGPAAYLASKSEQDAVASRIWAGGSGASDWVCAGIVGIG